ncbi:barstar family protein [Saccharothrix lopnurensis]|uniref:Barstar family protein n=1 Tax=Saccharothrix lopnurensis TaxID=1670621 RepID=A0ABW1PES7_9PSEU
MKNLELWGLGGPSLLVVSVECQSLFAAMMPPSGSVAVARLDGAAMIETHDVFDQFSRALRFPVYFGWNWDALSDCLRDLSWWPADRYLVIIDHAESILLGGAEERGSLLSILSQAAQEWANPVGKPNGEGIPFKVLLLCVEDSVEALRAEVDSW